VTLAQGILPPRTLSANTSIFPPFPEYYGEQMIQIDQCKNAFQAAAHDAFAYEAASLNQVLFVTDSAEQSRA
ncbi:hypothetical protein VU13_02595, partial [Desulfobulbus sp. US5]|nr:hypothetical protein [Desulfobulbus sp. US5]